MSDSTLSMNDARWDDPMLVSGDSRGYRGRPDWSDVVFFLVLCAGAAYALVFFNDSMDRYERPYWWAQSLPSVGWPGSGVLCVPS